MTAPPSAREPRGHCPVCQCDTIDRVGGEWCPRCQGWLQWVSEFGHAFWRVTRPI